MTRKQLFVGRKAELERFEEVLRPRKSRAMWDFGQGAAKKHVRRDP